MNNIQLTPLLIMLFTFGLGETALSAESSATPVSSVQIQKGFEVELIRSAGKDESSWISMTFDDKGRLILGLDDTGIGRLTLEKDPAKNKFEIIEKKLKHCRGLLYAHKNLYVSATNSNGFYRLKDTTGNDQYDQIQLLKKLDYQSRFGHGSNQVVLGPDNKIYLVIGNDVPFPDGISPNSPYRDPQNDHLLPNPHDGKHDKRVGYILRTDSEGTKWEVIAGGFRNQFDMAFNHEGEMFTHDADMEWDVGQPWYRPTRINHIISGGEYGWRWGTGKWPDYFEDSLPTSLDTGLGSPTGMVFGTKSHFPEKFKKALFTADWQNGRILMVTLTPTGASYSCDYEVFLEGAPLNVCDMEFGPDGSLYFITGGRGSQSGLYKVKSIVNSETVKSDAVSPATSGSNSVSSDPVKPLSNHPISTDHKSQLARKLRREMEIYHVRQDANLNFLWKQIRSEDRWLRFSARIAIENQEVSKWRNLALKEKEPTAAIAGLIALSRKGNKTDQKSILSALNKIDLSQLKQHQLLSLLRAYQICFIRLGQSDYEFKEIIRNRLKNIYPHPTNSVNHLLCELLVYLQDDSVVSETIKLLKENSTQEEQIRAARTLTFANIGWNKKLKCELFSWLNHARSFTGGKQLNQRIQDIQKDFLNLLSDQERKEFTLEVAKLKKPIVEESTVPDRPTVQEWTMNDLKPRLENVNSGRSYQNARKSLLAAKCLKCHRIGSSGAQIGPDLTTVGKRFNSHMILESIINPSKVMDEKYLYTVYALADGKVVTGRPIGVSSSTITIEIGLIKPSILEIPRDEIDETMISKVSPMPTHLIDVLTEEEILDLLAYIKSGGNPDDVAFQKPNKK